VARGRLKVVFLPDYNVSLAERLIPASDVSNQISTAGYEASGTSNMKFMMNGALIIGTRDGATISSDYFSRYEPRIFAPIYDALLTHGDHYMHRADLQSYLDADQRLCQLHTDRDGWARNAILNIAGSGKFSSDRTIAQYAAEIWNVKPCPVA
jgi:starch phosphorylase